MATDCIPQVTFRFESKGKPVVGTFDMQHASSDGGAILLKGIDTQLALTQRMVECLKDGRQPGKVQHQTLELLRQRVFGLACGYADCNDAARLADDAIHKLLLDRDPIAGPALASQPTLSRFENAVGWRELLAMGHGLAETVIEHHRRRLHGRATRITIDLDPTDDPTHGQQEFTSSMGTTTRGAICRSWPRSRSTPKPSSMRSRRSCVRATRRPAGAPMGCCDG